ncbi:MAG: phosphate ABC transporter ATP-binding protein [Cyanobacteria bacterium J06641_5]
MKTLSPQPLLDTITPLLKIDNLCLSYGRQLAFEDVSLPIHTGQITAIVGPSGCGKSSFLSCLNRMSDLIPNCQVSGAINLDDVDITSPQTDTLLLRRRIGMIFQKPNPFPLSIWENLALPLREHGVRKLSQLDMVIEAVLQDVGLWAEVKDRLHSSALRLSGGQQQRLCIARAIVLQPEILLLDEPCSALDPIASGVVEDLIVRLRPRYTQVIVTHNLAQARRIADRVAVFWVQGGAGRLIEFGPTEQIFSAPCHELTAAYISGNRG